MFVDEFDYDLPEELIAQTPVYPRDSSRLLVVDRRSQTLSHRTFRDVVEYLQAGDVLVVNDTRVIPARLFAKRPTGGKVEVLLLRNVGENKWECLVRPGRKIRLGDLVEVHKDGELLATGKVLERTEYGGRVIQWECAGGFERLLEVAGTIPLPPYIHEPLKDPERYQTVYAAVPGSAAAPTAGLHFTPELLQKVEDKGVSIEKITLDVGLGTFRPVKERTVEEHVMHDEHFTISPDAADAINQARQRGGKVVAVGTTVVRALESAACGDGAVAPYSGNTRLFIYPGYKFKVVDRLITNFHLPKSTLLMLVSAFAGKELIMRAYREAVAQRYRFFSFGDAMLIL